LQTIAEKKMAIKVDNKQPLKSTEFSMSRLTSSASSSGVITFKAVAPKTGMFETQDEHFVGVFDPDLIDVRLGLAPMRTSTPAVTCNVPDELDDLGIQMVQDLLHKHNNSIAGLQYVGYGEFRGAQVPKFSCAEGLPFVQILNVGDHWLCVTNVFGRSSHELYVFDSLQRKRLSDIAIAQVSAILRDDYSSEEFTIHVRKFVRQPARSRACGLYASAAAFACVNGADPTGFFYDVPELRDSIRQRVIEDRCDNLPGIKRWPVTDVAEYKARKVYCSCHKPCRRRSQMVQCSLCYHWFHIQCVTDVPLAALQNTIVPWIGPCCEYSHQASIVRVTD
jgi:hypothetical protein